VQRYLALVVGRTGRGGVLCVSLEKRGQSKFPQRTIE
jgi:hypothetical protein